MSKFASTFKKRISTFARLFQEKQLLPIPQPTNVQRVLDDKVALITGATGGIGYAIAEDFVNAGARVIVSGRSEDRVRSCAQRLGAIPLVVDVTDTTSLSGKVVEAAALGGGLDILVNAAGVIAHSDFLSMGESEYDEVMATNAKGTYFMSQAVARYMIDNGVRGHILNVSSSSALRPAWSPYHMSKWAVRGLTLGMADVLIPHGIVVNAIAPGPTATKMLGKEEGESVWLGRSPSNRYALPSEIAHLATFMVSDLGDMIVGDTVYMTGGSGVITLHN